MPRETGSRKGPHKLGVVGNTPTTPKLTGVSEGDVIEWKSGNGTVVTVQFLNGESPFGWFLAVSQPGQPLSAMVLPGTTRKNGYAYRVSDSATPKRGKRMSSTDPEIVVDGGREKQT